MVTCACLLYRLTANGVDLNRNFPDIWHNKHEMPIQNETQAVIDWLPKHNFILSGNIQDGGFVVNYPFDQYTNGNNRLAIYLHLLKNV